MEARSGGHYDRRMRDITAPRTDRWLVDIADATDRRLCGDKAVGLAILKRTGASVPRAICLTTAFYRDWLDASGARRRVAPLISATHDTDTRPRALDRIRQELESTPLSVEAQSALREAVTRLTTGRGAECLAVRSSSVEVDRLDGWHTSHEPIRMLDGHDMRAVAAAVKSCWTSLWTEGAWGARERLGIAHASAAMAVVVQRYVVGVRSGTASSGRVLDGASDGRSSVLTDLQLRELAGVARTVERALGTPVDIDWVHDEDGYWAVQATPLRAA